VLSFLAIRFSELLDCLGDLHCRDGHGLGPSMGWVRSEWVEFLANVVNWVWFNDTNGLGPTTA